MTFFIEICVSGMLRRDQFEAALNQALVRHPLLTAQVSRTWRGPVWCQATETVTTDWSEGTLNQCSLQNRQIDLTQEAGLRISVGWTPTSSRIVFQFHHAAADGIAGIQFIGDVLAFYGLMTAEKGEPAPEPVSVQADVLARRSQLWEPAHQPGRLLQRLLVKGWEVLHTQPCGLRGSQEVPDSQSPANPFVTRILDRAAVRDIRKQAIQWNVTPNELYTLAMFQTLHDWNRQDDSQPRRGAIRIGIPVTLRTPTHDLSPAANILSYIFLTQNGRQIGNRDALLSYIHRETQSMMAAWDSRLVPLVFDFIRRIPAGMQILTGMPRRFSTSMLANVGDVKKQLRNRFPIRQGKCVAGNVVLEYLLGAAPNRPGTSLGTSLGTYAGQLFINLNCDPYHFTSTEAEELADLFVDRLNGLRQTTETSCTGDSDRSRPASQPDESSVAAELTANW
jgi:hypothetical protein